MQQRQDNNANNFRTVPSELIGVSWNKTPNDVVANPIKDEPLIWLGVIRNVTVTQKGEKIEIEWLCEHLYFIESGPKAIAGRPIKARAGRGYFALSLIVNDLSIEQAIKFKKEHIATPHYILAGGKFSGVVERGGIIVPFLFTCRFDLGADLAMVESGVFPQGIVYGPKAAFQVKAPDEWLLDNSSGLDQGLPCVLYLRDSNWGKSPVIMYAKIASPEFEDYKTFAEWAAKELEKQDSKVSYKQIASGLTEDKHKFIVNEFYGDPYGNIERVAYIQLPKSVAYIVLSAKDKENYLMHAKALNEVLQSFKYTPEYIGYVPK